MEESEKNIAIPLSLKRKLLTLAVLKETNKKDLFFYLNIKSVGEW